MDGRRQLGRLFVPGHVVLYDQPSSPWRFSSLTDDERSRMVRAGADLEVREGAVLVHWSERGLRDFMLFDVLMHELGHHMLQHNKGKRTVRVARTRDHESFADRLAERCRLAYEVAG